MTLAQIYKAIFAEVVEDSFGTDLSRVICTGPYRDDKMCPFNRLSRQQIDTIIRSAGIVKADSAKELSTDHARSVARFVIQNEYWKRNGAPDKAISGKLKLDNWLRVYSLTYNASSAATVFDDGAESDTAMSTQPVLVEDVTTVPSKKSTKKRAGSKAEAPAKKSTKKEQLAAANADRKARLAEKTKEPKARKASSGEVGVRPSKSKFDGMKFKVDKEAISKLREGSAAGTFIAHAQSLRQPFNREALLLLSCGVDDRSKAERDSWNAAVTLFEVAVRNGHIVAQEK